MSIKNLFGKTVTSYEDVAKDVESTDFIDEVVAKQDKTDEPVRAFQELLGAFGAGVIGAGKMAQPVTVERHQAGFGTGKERGKQDKNEQDAIQDTEWYIVQELPFLLVTRCLFQRFYRSF